MDRDRGNGIAFGQGLRVIRSVELCRFGVEAELIECKGFKTSVFRSEINRIQLQGAFHDKETAEAGDDDE